MHKSFDKHKLMPLKYPLRTREINVRSLKELVEKRCYDLNFSVLFLFIYLVLLSVLSSLTFCQIHALVFPSHISVFLFDLSPNTSRVCVCTIRSFPEFWYLLRTWFTSRFLEFHAAVLICIVINSP